MNNQSFSQDFDNSQLPYSLEAEQAVLGAVLFDQSCLNTLLEMLRPECFYVQEHREIFSAMNRLFKTGAPVDFVTVLNETVTVGAFTEDTGKKYLYNLTQSVPQIRNYEAYAKIIRDKYELRALVNASREIIADAVDESNEASVVLDRAEQRIYEIAHLRASQGLVPISELPGVFIFDEGNLTLRSRDVTYRLADRVRVRVEEADVIKGKLRFSVVDDLWEENE